VNHLVGKFNPKLAWRGHHWVFSFFPSIRENALAFGGTQQGRNNQNPNDGVIRI
jgi:hypothetical protein